MRQRSVTPDDLRAMGWEQMPDEGFLALIGPMWRIADADGIRFGLLAEPRHHNKRGVVQGGMLMTLADRAMGMASRAVTGNQSQVTVQLDVHFVSAAEIGEFVEARGEVVRKTNSLVFVRGTLVAGSRIIATGNGIWKAMREPAAASRQLPA